MHDFQAMASLGINKHGAVDLEEALYFLNGELFMVCDTCLVVRQPEETGVCAWRSFNGRTPVT